MWIDGFLWAVYSGSGHETRHPPFSLAIWPLIIKLGSNWPHPFTIHSSTECWVAYVLPSESRLALWTYDRFYPHAMRKWQATGRKPNIGLGLLLPLVGLDLPFMEISRDHKTHETECQYCLRKEWTTFSASLKNWNEWSTPVRFYVCMYLRYLSSKYKGCWDCVTLIKQRSFGTHVSAPWKGYTSIVAMAVHYACLQKRFFIC